MTEVHFHRRGMTNEFDLCRRFIEGMGLAREFEDSKRRQKGIGVAVRAYGQRMPLEKVTPWSAETADGAFYAERTAGRLSWTLWRRSGRKLVHAGTFPSYAAVVRYFADFVD